MPDEKYRLLARTEGTNMEKQVRSIITYLKQHHRWVSTGEIKKELGYQHVVVYFVLLTLRVMGFVEEARMTTGAGRPAAVFHWIHGRPRPIPESAPLPSYREEGETRGHRSMRELAGPPAPSAPPTRIDVPARPSDAPPAPEASEK